MRLSTYLAFEFLFRSILATDERRPRLMSLWCGVLVLPSGLPMLGSAIFELTQDPQKARRMDVPRVHTVVGRAIY